MRSEENAGLSAEAGAVDEHFREFHVLKITPAYLGTWKPKLGSQTTVLHFLFLE
jgi:hypothetical protein